MTNLPDKLAKVIQNWGLANIPEKDVYVDGDNAKGREDESHVTVKYGLVDAKPSRELLGILKNTKPFDIELGPISLFRNDNFDVVKMEVISPELRALNSKICKACPNEDKHPEYNPHVTIAYVKPGAGDRFEGQSPWDWVEKLGVSDLKSEGKFRAAGVVFSSKDEGEVQELRFGDES
jgi:2'-5' RNA ligase